MLQEAASTSLGERALYRTLSALAGWEPFLKLLRSAAFVVIRRTAEQRGVRWHHVVQELQSNPEVCPAHYVLSARRLVDQQKSWLPCT